MGNLLYMLPNGIVTFVKYDSRGEPFKDANGKNMYFDTNGNVYNENNRGSKIKRSGHQLDRLIELLSPESRLLLETRMLTIPMNLTEKNNSVSVIDVLLKKGILDAEQKISTEQYTGWIEQHKKTFEDARYSGQKNSNVNVEFLYHLATQLKAVAQFKIDPKNNQKFTITEEEMSKLPVEIKQLASSYPKLISEELIKLLANDEIIKKRVINILSNINIIPLNSLTPLIFCKMIKLMSEEEILYTSKLCYVIDGLDKQDMSINDEILFRVACIFKSLGMTSVKTIEYLVQLKEIFDDIFKIENDGIKKILDTLEKRYSDYISINNKIIKYDINPKINNDIYYNDYIINK